MEKENNENYIINDVKKNIMIINLGINSEILLKKKFNTLIVVNVLKDSIKEIENNEWTWSKEELGKIKNGYWKIENEIKYIYYENSLSISLNKNTEKFIDNLRLKFLNSLKAYKKDIEYIWTIECSNIIHFNFLVTIEYSLEFRNWIRKKWTNLINKNFEDPCTDTSKIKSLKNAIKYIIKGPLKIGINLKLKKELLSYKNLINIYKYNEFTKEINLLKKTKENLKKIQLFYEKSFIEKAIFKLEKLHFYNIIKPIGEKVKNKFFKLFDYLNENKNKNKEYFLLMLLFISRTRIYKLLLNIINLCYICFIHNIRRSKISFCLQLVYFIKSYIFNKGLKVENLGELSLNDMNVKFIKDEFKNYFKNERANFELGFKFYNIITEYCLNDIFLFQNIREEDKDWLIIELKENIIAEYKIKYEKIFLYGCGPMIVEPKNWELKSGWATENKKGGYLTNGINFYLSLGKKSINIKEKKYKRDLKFTSLKFIKVINFLQKIPFEIDIMLYDYIVKNKDKIIELFYGKRSNQNDFDLIKEKIKKEKKNNIKLKEEYEKMISKNSKIDQFLREIKVCEEYKKYDKFYFIYNVDFRGRIYPYSEHLNYQSSKFIRSILRFYNKSKIDLNQSFWFKIQCAKLFVGNIGMSADELENFFNKILLEKIINWNYELDFWIEANEPWLFLACIFEYKRFLSLGIDFFSGFMAWADATCSGSQLISLLLGIDKYAADLNLVKSTKFDIPGDYYARINEEFIKFLIKNELKAKENVNKRLETPIEKEKTKKIKKVKKLLLKLDKNILRKLFKKIIMTVNYGLTKMGMLKKLKEIILELKIQNLNNNDIKWIRDLFYDFIQGLVLYKSLDKLEEIAKYLIDLDKVLQIYSSTKGIIVNKNILNTDMVTSPIYYKYHDIILDHQFRVNEHKNIKRKLRRRMTVRIYDKNLIDKEKYIRALKANLIHHLDSLWIYSFIYNLLLNKNFINMAIIHDCYSTDLNSVNIMNFYLRKTLQELFKNENVLWKVLHSALENTVSSKELEQAITNKNMYNLFFDKNKQFLLIKDIEHSFYLVFP